MGQKSIQTSPAFLLQKSAFGESDLILTFFTRDFGKIRGIAKGARASQKRFGGRLDFFHMAKLFFKPGKHDLAWIDSLELVEIASHFHTSLETFTLGQYCLELVRELTQEEHPEMKLFDLLHASLRFFETGAMPPGLVARFFEINILDLLGFRPTLDQCSACGDEQVQVWKYFSAARGGVVCEVCRPLVRGHMFSLTPDLLELFGQSLRLGRGEGDCDDLKPLASAAPAAQRVLQACLEEHLRRPLQSLKVLAALA